MTRLSVTANRLLTTCHLAVRWHPLRLRPAPLGSMPPRGAGTDDGPPRSIARSRRPDRALHLLVYIAFLALLVEGAAIVLAKLPSTRTVLFSGEAGFVEQLRSMERFYPRFIAERYDGVLGWDNPRDAALVKRVCAGHTVTETYLEDRSRRTPADPGGRAILAVGDSFTLGAEVD